MSKAIDFFDDLDKREKAMSDAIRFRNIEGFKTFYCELEKCWITPFACIKRQKKEIKNEILGLDFINTVRPVQFEWDTRDGNVKDGSTRIGFLAQELLTATDGNNAVLDLVLDDNPDKLEAKQGNLLPIMVQAIKDLSAKNDALEARIVALENA